MGQGLWSAWSAGDSTQEWGRRCQVPHSETHTRPWPGTRDAAETKLRASCTQPAKEGVGNEAPSKGKLVPRQLGGKGRPMGGKAIAQVEWSVVNEGRRGGGILGLERPEAGLRDFIPRALKCL